ncbi:MAG: hypothetical protein HY367_01405 [Candidatus Aenigmarchaeota archaeon]|nr:hypothetical protein [Candidatus Aenigmarchaeota archaeon]
MQKEIFRGIPKGFYSDLAFGRFIEHVEGTKLVEHFPEYTKWNNDRLGVMVEYHDSNDWPVSHIRVVLSGEASGIAAIENHIRKETDRQREAYKWMGIPWEGYV